MNQATIFSKVLPRRLILELTRKCNLHCHMCIAHSLLQDRCVRKEKDLSQKILDKISPIIKTLEYLELGGLGEPLLAKDITRKILLFREINPKLKIILFTNGRLLKNTTICETVFDTIDYMQISVNGLGKSYEENMSGSSWSEMEQILTEIKEKKKKTWIAFGFIVMKNNWLDLFRLLFVARKYSVQEIALKDLWIAFPSMKKLCVRDSGVLEVAIFFIIGIVRVLAFFLKVQITTLDFPIHHTWQVFQKNNGKECRAPWSQIQIKVSGEVSLCCNGGTVIGNLHHDSLERIWNSSKAMGYRRGLLEKTYFKECGKCKMILGRTTKALVRKN